MTTTKAPGYWFAAKRYGWGWGLPLTWQGWLVLASFVALQLAGTFLLLPLSRAGFVLYVTALAGALVLICYRKGEPPTWRWGKR